MKFPMTYERQKKIEYLLERAYPTHRAGMHVGLRKPGYKEFYAGLCDQPDTMIGLLYESAKQEEARLIAAQRSASI